MTTDWTDLAHVLEGVLADIARPELEAVALLGSWARGEARRHSDVDLNLFVRAPPADRDRYRLLRRQGFLFSLSADTIEGRQETLRRPERAIWDVPGLQQCRILLDRDGRLGALQRAAQDFVWFPLQPKADAYAADEMMGYAEEVSKLLNGLEAGNDSVTLYGLMGILHGMPRVVAVRGGVMIASENTYYHTVQAAMGHNSTWSRAFRAALGLDGPLPVPERGEAALNLYRETAHLVLDTLRGDDLAVVQAALSAIAERRVR